MGKPVHEFYSYFGEFNCIKISNCGRFCIAGGVDNRISVYVLELNCVLFRLGGGPRAWISSVDFDDKGSNLENCDKFLIYYKSLIKKEDDDKENDSENNRKSSFRKPS